jgi:copper chaperone NosL
MPKAFRYLFFLILVALVSCTRSLAPVSIEEGDMCSFCRMAISEKRFAAEIIMTDESVLKFDDIGCMLRYQKAKGSVETAAVYVADSETKQWLMASDAYFVQSTTVKTPMGSGIVAFASGDSAGAGAMRFSELQDK